MLSEQDKAFMAWWEQYGSRQRRWLFRFPRNFSIGLIFSALIISFFLIDGQRDRSLVSHGDLIIISAGSLLVALFYAILSGQMGWEKNDSRYTILKLRQKKEDTDPQIPPPASP